MFRTTFYFLTILLAFLTNAQENLIVNGSFEEYTSCPTGNDLGDGQFQKCVGWWYSNPSGIGTPDYFNRCATSIVGVPNNFWGYQEAYDGDGYVGILPAEWYINEGIPFGKEIIQTKLKQSLIPCKKYIFSIKLNLSNYSNYSLSRLELVFSKDSLFHATIEEVEEKYKQIISIDVSSQDTTNWTKINREFIVDDFYNYLSIGYFSSFKNLEDTIFRFDSNVFSLTAVPYYYLDDVQLLDSYEETTTNCNFNIPNSFTPNNDGINDLYDLTALSNEFNFIIVNRWGNLIFELSENNQIWDGNSKSGNKCSDGVYYYQMSHKKTKEVIKSGFIHLFR